MAKLALTARAKSGLCNSSSTASVSRVLIRFDLIELPVLRVIRFCMLNRLVLLCRTDLAALAQQIAYCSLRFRIDVALRQNFQSQNVGKPAGIRHVISVFERLVLLDRAVLPR